METRTGYFKIENPQDSVKSCVWVDDPNGSVVAIIDDGSLRWCERVFNRDPEPDSFMPPSPSDKADRIRYTPEP